MIQHEYGDMPNTPLMEEAPTQIGRADGISPEQVPQDSRRKKRDKIACIGVLILAGIIALALIIVGIKEATDGPAHLMQEGIETTTLDSVEQTSVTEQSETSTNQATSESTIPPESLQTTDPTKSSETTTLSDLESSTTDAREDSPTSEHSEASTEKSDASTDASTQKSDASPIDSTDSIKSAETSTDSNIVEDDNIAIDELAIDPSQSADDSDDIFDDENSIDEVQNFEDIQKEIDDMDVESQSPNNQLDDIQKELDTMASLGGIGKPEGRAVSGADGSITSIGVIMGHGLGRAASPIVYCDPKRELRCKDRSQCYPVAKHCDFKVDCNDYSDENDCTCKQRLIDVRLCDGYVDCREGDDETTCNCPPNHFFCDMEPFDKPLCVREKYTCDAVEDCRNARDEDGCIMNFPHTLPLDQARPAFSHSSGLLTVKVEGSYKYLAVGYDQLPLLEPLALRTCDGLIDFEQADFKTIEYEFAQEDSAIIDEYNNETKRFRFAANDGRIAHAHLVHVRCLIKTCNAYQEGKETAVQSRVKRAHEMDESLMDIDPLEIAQAIQNGSISAPRSSDPKIVGGTDSNIEIWPSTLAIYRNSKFICGGTLINPSWIVTAGHCLQHYEKQDRYFSIRIGMQRKQSQSPWEQTRFVKEVYIHPDYEPTFLNHDLSLGKLDSPVMINRFAQPACLPFNADMTPEPGQTCTAAGWGLISEKGLASEELKEVKLNVLDGCSRGYNDYEHQICAGAKLGMDSCQGDSGGPLYCQSYSGENYLGGVISHGKGCGREGEPGVYVRLTKYYEWIAKVLSGSVEKKGEPLQVCPGTMCGTGECVMEGDLCDEDVDCLDNSDVKFCKVVNGNRVQVLPEDVSFLDDPNLGKVDEDPFEEKKPLKVQKQEKDQPETEPNTEHSHEHAHHDGTVSESPQSTTEASKENHEDHTEHETENHQEHSEQGTENQQGHSEHGAENQDHSEITTKNPSEHTAENHQDNSGPETVTQQDNDHAHAHTTEAIDTQHDTEDHDHILETTTVQLDTTMMSTTTEEVVITTTELPIDKSNWPVFNKTTVVCDQSEFRCLHVDQCINGNLTCDGKLDCPDMSDEIGCKCGDLLGKTHPELINDGYADCEDSSDEKENICGKNEFRCPGSDMCISSMQRCNAYKDCPHGEDEQNCAILVNDNMGKKIDIVKKANSGYLIIYSKGKWKPVCVSSFKYKLTNNLCNYMGFASPGNFRLVPKSESPLNKMSPGKRDCNHIFMTCGAPKCGDRIAARQRGVSVKEYSGGLGVHPWSVSLLVDGQFVCTGSLIHPGYVITAMSCGISVLKRDGMMVAVAGEGKVTPLGMSPYTQVRKLLKFKVLPKTQVVIGNLESPFEITDYVRHLCRGQKDFDNEGVNCQISGRTNISWSEGYPVTVAEKCGKVATERYDLCSCEYPDIDNSQCSENIQAENTNTEGWHGALACPDEKGSFSFVGLRTKEDEVPTQFSNLVSPLLHSSIPSILRAFSKEESAILFDECNHRCKMGNCVEEGKMCDGVWDCHDGSDEQNCSVAKDTLMKCEEIQDSPGLCICPEDHGKCDNNVCIPNDSFCDGNDDCGDGSDEKEGCNDCLAKMRFSGSKAICDGIADCPNGEDETVELCGCPTDHFHCSDLSNQANDTNICQPMERLCDGRKHCQSGADEDFKYCISLGSKTDMKENTGLEPVGNNFGIMKVRFKGVWYQYCMTGWKEYMGVAVCSVLGFNSLSVAIPQSPNGEVTDIGYLATGIKSPPCSTIYLVCQD